MQETELINLLRQQDPQGLEALQLHYAPLMRYIIAPILPNPQDREECLSEVFLRVWEKIALYDSKKGSWTAWLTALTRNTALNRARKAPSGSTEELSSDIPSPEPTPEEALLRRERQELLARALQRLSPREKTLFYRKYYYRQSTAQIARELGMTERAVEGRLYRLRKQLRELMGGDGYA